MKKRQLLKKISLAVGLAGLISSAFAGPIIRVTPASSQVLVPLGATANIAYTITNISGTSLPISQVRAKYQGSGASALITSSNCTGTLLSNNGSCSETVQLTGSRVSDDKLNLWVYAFNNAIGSRASVDVSVVAAGYAIGGSISGLDTTGLELQNNGGDTLTVSASTTSFQFPTPVADGGTYQVTVSKEPVGETCSVSHETGTATSNVSNVQVVCSDRTYTLGGEVSGLSGSLTLTTNGLTKTITAEGTYTFDSALPYGTDYEVTVSSQPTNQTCTVTNATGTLNSNVTNVDVSCVSNASCKGTDGACRVFMTSGSMQGSMNYDNTTVDSACGGGTQTGLSKANCICQQEGGNVNGASWAAWLSTDEVNAKVNISYADSLTYIRLSDGAAIAGPGALLSGTLENAIDGPAGGNVFTATRFDGTSSSSISFNKNCANWTSNSGWADYGQRASAAINWTQDGGFSNACAFLLPIYCFEKPSTNT